jgi:hypothetical protein
MDMKRRSDSNNKRKRRSTPTEIARLAEAEIKCPICRGKFLRCHRILLKSVVTLGLKGYVFYRIKPT